MLIYEIVSDYGYGDIGSYGCFLSKEKAIRWCKEHEYVGFNLEHLFDQDLIHHIEIKVAR